MNIVDVFYSFIYRLITLEWLPGRSSTFSYWLGHVKALLISLSIALTLTIIYLLVRLRQLIQADALKWQVIATTPGEEAANEEWAKILELLASPNQSDWKVAIFKADIILDELIKKIGYDGDNLGERLKQVEPSDLATLNDAWEAHKVRNELAHEGDSQLDQHRARLTIERYERVFEELEYL